VVRARQLAPRSVAGAILRRASEATRAVRALRYVAHDRIDRVRRQIKSHPVVASLIWGQNREIHGVLDGYLFEWDVPTKRRGAFYGRAEAVAKDLLDLGAPAPLGIIEFHRISHVAALTLGYVQDLAERPWGRIGVGADATVYHVPQNMLEYYGAPHSYHVFVRYRPNRSASAAHVHR